MPNLLSQSSIVLFDLPFPVADAIFRVRLTKKIDMLLNTGSAVGGLVSFPKNAMKLKMRPVILVATVAGGFWCGIASAQGPGGPDQPDGAPSGEAKPAPKPRARWPKALKLPDQYRSRDVDKDGQIGMYEWPRTDFATFRRLDLNHDGFLTPQELLAPPSGRTSAPVVAATPAPPVAPLSVAPGVESRPARTAESTGAGAAPTPSPPPGGQTSEADRFFDLIDKDKNDKVTEDEFKKSFLMSKKFADAGIALSFPVSRDEFIRQYPQPAGK